MILSKNREQYTYNKQESESVGMDYKWKIKSKDLQIFMRGESKKVNNKFLNFSHKPADTKDANNNFPFNDDDDNLILKIFRTTIISRL